MNNFISVRRGSSAGGLVRYLFGLGSSHEHTDQRIIAADVTLGLAEGMRLDHVADAEAIYALGRDMDSHRILLGVAPPGGWVWHCAISLPPGEVLADAQWAEVARTAITRMEFDEAAGRAPCRWIAVHHGCSVGGNEHIHLMVNLVREDGELASTWNDRRTMSRVCADMERRYGLAVVEGRAGRGMPGYSKAEHQRMRAGEVPERQRIARLVRSCALVSGDEAEFVRRARRSGLSLKARYSTDRQAVVGYSIALRDRKTDAPDGADRGSGAAKQVWFGGGRLAADLSLPRLREHWPAPTAQSSAKALAQWSRDADVAGPRETPEQVVYDKAVWRQAIAQVEAVTARLGQSPAQDAALWSSAARHAAALMAGLSARLEGESPGPITATADLLARAAQTPTHSDRRLVRRGGLADLRGVAMVIRHARTSPEMRLLLPAVVALTHAIGLRTQTERPRLAAELAAGLAGVRTAYPPPSARELAANLRSVGAPGPPMGPPGTDPAARARRSANRDRGGRSQGRGR
ncbi:relaxase/mobilization nuclease domain-containing protein [Streptosporangium canum]|uniref:relaxase/mobilization nuclease domain-containing protein n=1 Tax=Streptosporangium canum TaxID=324952 RepID=UPI0036AF676E